MPETAPAFKEPAAESSATIMINEHLPCAAASVARDGEAPESSHDGSLRAKCIRAVRFADVWQATF